jgi:hypothetical protein
MEKEIPYLLGNDGTARYYYVQRKCDHSFAGIVRQTDRGWVAENMLQVEHKNIPPFPSCEDAALFLYMQGRAYQSTFDIEDKRIQVRVSPNFGQWPGDGCEPGLWAASLHYEGDGTAGPTRCARSVAEAKIAGIQCAYYDKLLPATAQYTSERAQWEDIPVPHI